MAALSFAEFVHIGREQRHVQRGPLAKLFYTLFGPLSTHAHIRIASMLQAVEELHLPAEARVLEAGSGHGYATLSLAQRNPGWECVGLELDPRQVDEAQHIAQAEGLRRARFVCTNLVTHGEAPNSYDLILSGDVLEHIVEDELVLTKFADWLKPGGYLILHLPLRHQLEQRFFPMFRQHSMPDHVRDEYTEDEIRVKVTQAGLIVKRLTYTFGPAGELAFELNKLFWWNERVRRLIAMATFPIALPLAYLDHRLPKRRGNCFIVEATKEG